MLYRFISKYFYPDSVVLLIFAGYLLFMGGLAWWQVNHQAATVHEVYQEAKPCAGR